MVDDIEEMDRIIGQFLDFARGDHDDRAGAAPTPNALVARRASTATRARASDVRFAAGARAGAAAAADGVLAAGRQPRRQRARVRRAAGRGDDARRAAAASCSTSPIAAPASRPADVERLKQPFTRAIGRAQRRAAASPAPGSASRSSTASRGCTAGRFDAAAARRRRDARAGRAPARRRGRPPDRRARPAA